MTSQTVRRGAPLAAGVAVVVVLAGSAYLLRDDVAGPGSQPPPPLRIGAGVAAADHAGTDGRVKVSAELPAGPDSALVHRFRSAEDGAVRGLADTLGVDPAQVRADEPFPADQGTVLRVGRGQGGQWQFARAGSYVCLDQPLGGSPDAPVSSTCAAPPPKRRPALAPAPSVADASAAAGPVLSAVGLDIDDAQVGPAEPFGGELDTRTVRVDPVLDELPTSGLTTTVSVDDQGIVSASGWLGERRAGDRYPVISARDAVDQLAAMPVPLIGCPESTTPVPPGCGGPLEVTGASFGLSLQWEGEKPVLVPSWLFAINGSPEPLPVVAVDPSYLQNPAAPSGDEPSDGASGGGVPGSPGSVDPASPVAPAVEPTPASSRFDSVSPVDGGAALAVTFYGGADSCYTYKVVAEESAEQVSLGLVEDRSGEMCIELAQQYKRTIELEQPLGERVVVDAETGLSLYPVRAEH